MAEALTEVAALQVTPTTNMSEPTRVQMRRWTDKPWAWKAAANGNSRRWRGRQGKALHRLCSPRVRRTFAHAMATGRGRRTWIRGVAEVGKRYLMRVAGPDLGTILSNLIGACAPRRLAARAGAFLGSSAPARLILLIAHRTSTFSVVACGFECGRHRDYGPASAAPRAERTSDPQRAA